MKIGEAFALSDISTGRSGFIPAKEVVNVARVLGQCPTQLEVQELIIEVDLLRRSRLGINTGTTKKKSRKQKSERSKPIYENGQLVGIILIRKI